MKRMGDKGTDLLTIGHKLVGAAWVVGALGALVLTVGLMGSSGGGAEKWAQVALFQRVASTCSVITLLFGLAYGIWTAWGFARHRGVLGKWALFLLATAFDGPSITFARAHSATLVVALTVAELLALIASMVAGVLLERYRHAGKLSSAASGR